VSKEAKDFDLIMIILTQDKIHMFVLELILCYFYTAKKKEQKTPSLKY